LQLPINELFSPAISFAAAAAGDKSPPLPPTNSSSISCNALIHLLLLLPCVLLCCLQLPISELFSPLISYAAAAADDKSSSLALRGAAAAVLAIGCYGLYAVGPNAETVKDNLQGARDSVLNYFVSGKLLFFVPADKALILLMTHCIKMPRCPC
jgi:hypothetical protein